MAEFVGISLSNHELEDVLKATSFQEMKKNKDKYNAQYLLEFGDLHLKGVYPEYYKTVVSDDSLIVIGPGRKGDKEMSPRLKQIIRNELEEEFGIQITNWLYDGGEIPDVEIPKRG